MTLREIVESSAAVAATRSRRQKVERLADCLARLRGDEVAAGVAFLSGALRHGRIGVGYAALREARCAGAAESSLGLLEVDRELQRIGRVSGAGSSRDRARRLGAIFARATEAEQHFVGRLILGELRQGASEKLMVEALARAAGVDAARVRRALMFSGELARVAEAALADGGAGLDAFSLELFRPLRPMLAQPAGDVEQALARLGETALELKLDGARIQVHRRDDEVRVYSRRLHDVTAAVPEVVEAALALPAREVILDGELLALRADGWPLPFQTTMRRFGRRLDVDRMRRELPLRPFFFDCLALDGQALIDRDARERAAALASAVGPESRVERRVTADPEVAEAFWGEAVAGGHEGLMAKSLDGPYEAGGRGGRWLKLKPAHTLDLVVLAAEWGSGRRRGWLSNLHLGARDPAAGGFVMLGKTFKGLTDATLAWQTERLQQLELAREDHIVHVRPELVAEIAFNEVQVSPHYPGGLALRFARVKRYRDDKTAAEADTIETVREIHLRARGGQPLG